MKKLFIGGLVALMLAAAVPALAQVAPNPGTPQSAHSNNCIAIFASHATHNGQAPTLGSNAAHGARGQEIKALQAACGGQAKK